MKKMTKLLSVILAFVMALSCMTMMASAEKAKYQTVENLEALADNPYSPYGTVTRLSTEVRMSIIFDALDNLLEPMTNLNMGELFKLTNNLKLSVNLTSVNNILGTIDGLKNLLNNGAVKLVKWMLGTVQYIDVSTWQTGMTREGTAQLTIVAELLELISNNSNLVGRVLSDGITLGVANSALPDMSGINNFVKDLPAGIKGIVYPMFGRQDDTQTERNNYSNKSNDLIELANSFVNGLFTKPMAWTSYRVNAAGEDLGYTTTLPTTAGDTSRYFVMNDDGSITQWDYNYAGALGSPKAGYTQTVTYTKEKEFDTADCTTYVYKAPEGYDGDQTLKWYKADNKVDENGRVQSGYWIPSLKDGGITININGTDTVLGLIYQFIPYIFSEMAPTVLNGSAKKLIAEAFDVKFEKIGYLKSANEMNTAFTPDQDLQAVIDEVGNPDNFFTKAQDFYVWEYSDYKVIDGVPYYRFQNTYFKGEIPKNISSYYYMFNWNWKIDGTFFNEFIPETVGSTWAIDSLNNIVKKAINSMIAESWTVKGTTYTRDEVFNWQAGGNDKLLNNLMVCARAFFQIAPEEIVDEYFEEAQFYNAMMNGTMKQAVNGLVCELVKLIMPQIKFPDNIVDQPITAIAALVVRELCTQLMPTYNFDAMIYANYGDSTNKTRAILTGKSADYWLDTTLYMGVNLGMYYLRNLADIGEDVNLGYYSVMKTLGALPSTGTADGMTFGANAQYVNGTASWLYAIDWIVDWALDVNTLWCWHFGNFVDVGETVDLATYQNPLKKLNTIFMKLLPLDQFINVDNTATCVYGSDTFLERVLKNGIVDSIVNLDVPSLLNLLKKSDGYLTKGNIADTLVQIVAKLLNGIFYKLAGNKDLIPSGVNTVSSLLNQNNLKTIVQNLVSALKPAYDNGLISTVLPIANFFIGWTTDPQKYADPSIYLNTDYIRLNGGTGTATLKIRNAASGMLLKHRGSNVYDKSNFTVEDNPYLLNIESIESTDPNMTFSSTSVANLAPGDHTDITVTTTSDKTPCVIKVTSHIVGKTGEKLGESKTQYIYAYTTSTVSDIINLEAASQNVTYSSSPGITQVDYTMSLSTKNILARNSGQFFSGIENLAVTLANNRDATCTVKTFSYTGFDSSIISESDEAKTAASKKITSKGSDDANLTVKPANPNRAYDIDSLASATSFNLGKVKTAVEGTYISKKTGTSNDLYFGTLYYVNTADFDKLYEEEIKKARVAADYTSDTWATYENAMSAATAFTYEPITTATFPSYTDALIKEKYDALDAAVKGLKLNASASSTSPVSELEAALASAEDQEKEINFQNYQLFEYFKYENQRTAARKMINAYERPTAPTKYIKNDGASYKLISAIIDAKTGNIKTGIQASLLDPDEEAVKNFNIADKEWKAPTYSATEIEDLAEKVTYYRQFLIEKANADKTFLNQEITYAEAQGYVQDEYSKDSWSRYTKALEEAKAVKANASAKESEIFDAKYELMVAQNKLQLKERSMKDAAENYLAQEIKPLIATAKVILDNFGGSNALYTTKAGVTADQALAQLVSALGVDYSVEIDGETYEGILYDRSAITFETYDRTLTAKNKRAVDAAADKLREAIENFECTAVVESNDTVTTVDQSIRYIQGIAPRSVASESALLAKITVTGGTTDVTPSKSGKYGTGTRVDIKNGDAILASYFVVIKGDVNGDGAVDAFDAIEVDLANCTAYYMGDVYDDAADLNGDGKVDANDYSSLENIVRCR